jgi:hypothetical protein
MTDRSRTQRTALRPMAAMAESILELRESGQGELADALTRLREAWARAVAKHPHRHVHPLPVLTGQRLEGRCGR